MTIQVGDRLPQSSFRVIGPEGRPVEKTTDDVFKGRKVVLFAVPGAFTPTCHRNHMPGFVAKADEIKKKGVDAIVVTAVNDAFVLDAWTKASGCDGKIEYIADGNGDFARAIGLAFDASGNGLGTRSKRYSMVVEDGVVRALNVEDATSKAEISGAENILNDL